VLNCKLQRIPFIYHEILIEGDPRRMSLWYPLLECLNKGYLGGKA